MGKQFLVNVHIAVVHQIIELEDSELTGLMVDETAVAILKRHSSQGIIVVSFQWQLIFNI
jgi:hypothetical protein